ncbi:MAG: hypothetical protein JWQ35_1998 [Bacteriovoracaceae bacterium]|nr:hypothetical protein [Bacteriovoracaceae bacterium]
MAVKRNEINLLEIWELIKKRRTVFYSIVILFTFGGLIFSLVLPKTYKAKAVILPVTSSQDGLGGGLKDQLGALAGLLGSAMETGRSSSMKILVAVLQSQNVAERVIQRTHLAEVLCPLASLKDRHLTPEQTTALQLELAWQTFSGKITIRESKELPTITVEAVFENPETSARVVEAFLEELQFYLNNNAVTIAKRNRIFIEKRLAENNAQLLRAGKELAEFYQRNRISTSSGSIDVHIDEENISDRTDSKSVDSEKNSNIVKNVPQKVYYEHIASQKEVLRAVNSLLSTQKELARIDEVKEGLAFQVIDPPKPPPLKYGPKRLLICLLSLLLGSLCALIYVYLAENFSNFRKAKNVYSEEIRSRTAQ